MSLRLYLHTRNERAETSALLDSGATENFIHLDYARKKRLTVKQLITPRTIVNVDGTPNAKGEIRHYVDLDMNHGATKVRLRFFLTDIGDRDIILGYPWFAAIQPNIDWARGWIVIPASRRSGSSVITCVSNGLTGGTGLGFIDGELGMF